MSTLYDKWCSLKRGDIIKIESEKEDRIVSHSISAGRDSWVITFQNSYIVLWEEDNKKLIDFKVVGHYVCDKDKEISSLKAR
jgi:hypothetical protein